MCQHSLEPLLKSLPKVEHHMHIEGALTPALEFQLAAKNGISLPKDDEAFQSPQSLLERYERFTSLDDFLHYYFIGMSVLLDSSDFEALAWDYFTKAAADGVVHAEIFFDPQAHLERGISYETVLTGLTAARKRAWTELQISSDLILCFLRHLPVPNTLATFNLEPVQASFQRGEVTGIGLDSSEKEFPPENFKQVYQSAKALGLRLTAHAGEEGPAKYIESALDELEVERIDHGIRLADDPQLLERVVREGKLLSVCPLSNLRLQCVSKVAEVPIRKFIDAGVRFSINSDDPAYFGSYLLGNYVAVQTAFNLTVREWQTICDNSIQASWCSDARKADLTKRLIQVVDDWNRAHS